MDFKERLIKGAIKDEMGEPLIGVSILVKGASVGAVTDIDGNYTLEVPEGMNVLEISYIGYVTQVINIDNRTEINVRMVPDTQILEEVVVIGYGVQKKSNVTGSISSVKTEDLINRPTSNAASALQGKVAGVQIINNSGAPGATPTIRIRGYSSNGNSDPLFIVDGLKVTNIDYLEPSSIESIEVLKDAASAAIYGAEAGNGVVLVTTKTSKKGAGKIFFDTQFSFSSLANKMDLLNAEEFIQYYTEGAGETFTAQLDQFYYNAPSSTINGQLIDTDWQDAMYTTGVSQKYNVGFQGGGERSTFFASLGHLDNDGMIVGNSDLYKRITAQVNASYKIKDWLEAGINNSIEYTKLNQVTEGNVDYGTMSRINKIDPLTPVEYANGLEGASVRVQEAAANGWNPLVNNKTGNYYGVSWLNAADNPLALLARFKETNKAFKINGMAYLNLTPIKNFVFTSRLGYRLGNTSTNRYDIPGWLTFILSPEEVTPYLLVSQSTERYYQWENFANYNFDLGGNNFSLLAGMSYINSEVDFISANTDGLTNEADNFHYLDYSATTATDNLGGNTTKRVQVAYYGRFGWSYKNRYNVQVNFRADSYDAAYLDLEHNWGYFPSVSAGWTLTNEDFMENINRHALSFARLRLSWGKNGSVSNLGGYMYASSMNAGVIKDSDGNIISNNNYWLNGHLNTGLYPNEYLANPSLRWEESRQSGVGLDLRFLSDRLSVTADYYNKVTDGLLVRSNSSYMTGTSFIYQNLGKVNNHGLEFELEWKDQIGKDFRYGIKANLATVSNEVTEYNGTRVSGGKISGSGSSIAYFEEGYPLWYLRGYKIDRIDEATGAPVYKDIDGVEGITVDDRSNIGSAIPDFTYGATLSLGYKGFDLIVYGAGSQGSELMYGLSSVTSDMQPENKPMFLYEERWTSANPNAKRPSPLYQSGEMFYNSDAFVFDASFFKIKQIQLGYSLPAGLLNKISLSSLRAYVSLDNYFTFTSYPGNDPEVRPTDSDAMAIDLGGYPIAKSVTFGLNISF
jgi:TonB-linked SusC/RagA family outer membrane protein